MHSSITEALALSIIFSKYFGVALNLLQLLQISFQIREPNSKQETPELGEELLSYIL